MSLHVRAEPPWLATVLLAEDDTEESVVGSDLHQEAIAESHATLLEYAEAVAAGWYVSTQVSVIAALPEREGPWQPKPDLFVVPGVAARSRTSYDARGEGPVPAFVLEVASESTWRHDVGEKARLYGLAGVREYLVFDPAAEFLGEQLRGWRAGDGGWGRWPPAERADGSRVWESGVLGLAVRAEGLLLRFDHPERGTLPIRREIRTRLAQEQSARQQEEAARLAAETRLAQEQSARQAAERRASETDANAQRMQRDLEAALAEIARLRAEKHGS